MHVLKNGHPAHVFTDEDRRNAAAVTNEIRREKQRRRREEQKALMWIERGYGARP